MAPWYLPALEERTISRSYYHGPVAEFCRLAHDGSLVMTLADRAASAQSPAGTQELASWRNSLASLATLLSDAALLASDVFVELMMPMSAARCDVLLTGRDALGQARAVLLELKQWTSVERGPYPEHVLTPGAGNLPAVRLHPSAQVRGYVVHLRHFHSAFDAAAADPIELDGLAWLHNLRGSNALSLLRSRVDFPGLDEYYPVFGAADAERLTSLLRARLAPGPAADVSHRVETAPLKPSTKLLDLVVQTITAEHTWNLLDVQKTVYWAIHNAVVAARESGERRVIIVRGGPGTGKSVLAIQLLADAARKHWKVVHATGSKAFQTVLKGRTLAHAKPLLEAAFGKRKKKELPVSDIFTTFIDVAKAGERQPGDIDLVVGDEAHRLWEHRRIKYPNGMVKWLTDKPMVDEVILAAKVSAFFLDDNQSVRTGEIGQSSLIEAAAARLGIPVERFELDAQHRCAGSDSYIRWVEGLLGFNGQNDQSWMRAGSYQLILDATAGRVAQRLALETAAGHRCRMLAAYCWRWSKPDTVRGLPHDVSDPRFGGWSAPWIEKTGQHLAPEFNQYFLWATDESKREQVGSIYSVQGFEFDYVGVIWGEDLVWRSGRWVAQLDKNKDGAFKKELRNGLGKGASEEEVQQKAVAMLLNVYRVLLTRGMRGSFLTVLDRETAAYLESRLVAAYASIRA